MLSRLSASLAKVVVIAVVLAVAIGVGAYALFGGNGTKQVTARFASAVGVYAGTPVTILGVRVGKVDKVEPQGDYVAITVSYDDKYAVPADAIAVVVANSIVSDRSVQLAPAYTGHGAKLADGATIPLNRTASPAELDEIYAALNKLSIALGPKGANKHGSLSTLLDVAAANLQGNGAALGNSITQLSKAAKTLSDGRDDLFGVVRNLQTFTEALANSDGQIRHFEQQLAQVASDLASERQDLGAALKNLGTALADVARFVKDNNAKVHTDLGGLKDITSLLVKQKASLEETLAIGPVALSNVVHAYQPNIGVLGTRSNLASLTDPGQLCDLLKAGGLLAPVGNLLGPLSPAITSTCESIISKMPSGMPAPPSSLDPSQLSALITKMLGGLGGLVGAGG